MSERTGPSRIFLFLIVATMILSVSPLCSQTINADRSGTAKAIDAGRHRRVPAEWEEHEATWMQWPKFLEYSYRDNFCSIIDVLQEYEPVRVLVGSNSAMNQARNYLTNHGVPLTNIEWYVMDFNWAWMRDNGPVWSLTRNGLTAQDWGFDGWGGLVSYWSNDDTVPPQVAAVEGVLCEDFNRLINERGTLEFNGIDTLITSWPCLHDRNPAWSMEEMEALFKKAFGVTKVIWILSAPPDDFTKGHIDGIARFIDEHTVAVARYVDQNDPDAWIYEEAASIIAGAGLDVVRLDVPGYVNYHNADMPAIYMNWLVANGVVIMTGFGVPAWDSAAKSTVEGFFPGRDVHVVETLELWYWGGGVHCVTNDQPAVLP